MSNKMSNNYYKSTNYNNRKKLNKTIILLLISFLILCLISFIKYKFQIFNNRNGKSNSNINNYSMKTKNNDDPEYIKELKKLNYNVLVDDDGKTYYLEKINGKFVVKYDLGHVLYIGIYNNKLFFQDLNDKDYINVKYIDINEKDNISHDWLKINKIDNQIEQDVLSKAVIVDDTIYFDVGYSPAFVEKEGILTLKFSDNNFNDFKTLIPIKNGYSWFLDKNYKKIFYINPSNSSNKYNIYMYDLNSGKSSVILDNIDSYQYKYHDGKILYITYDENYNNILSLYNINTNEKQILSDKFAGYNMEAYFFGNYIYYFDNNGIIYQYNMLNNQSVKYYKMESISNYNSIKFITSNLMKISLWDNQTGKYNYKYIYKQKEIEFDGKIPVTMLDGTIKEYDFYNFKNIEN